MVWCGGVAAAPRRAPLCGRAPPPRQCLQQREGTRKALGAVPRKLEVVFEDDFLACVVKPRGLTTEGQHPSATSLLRRSLRKSAVTTVDSGRPFRPVFAHRLDQPAGGLLLAAKTLLAFAGITAMFQERRIRKRYVAVVRGELSGQGAIETPIDGKGARTEWRSLAPCGRRRQSLVELWPESGRKHQLRKHMLELGHPILGDRLYAHEGSEPDAAEGMWLWAEALALEHPMTGQALQFLLAEPELVERWRGGADVPLPRAGVHEELTARPSLSYAIIRRTSSSGCRVERVEDDAEEAEEVEEGEEDEGLEDEQDLVMGKAAPCAFAAGDAGVLFTTEAYAGAPGGSQRAAVGWLELVRLLEPARSPAGPAESEGHGAEDSQLRFAPSVEVTKGAGFLKFLGEGDVPSRLLLRALQRRRDEGDKPHEYLCQVLPLDHTCGPSLEDFAALARRVLPRHFAARRTWALVFHARGGGALGKEEALELICGIVESSGLPHRVDLGSPERCILVEVNPHFCGLSVVELWGELGGYRLDR